MKNKIQLDNMNERELIQEILKLQKILSDREINEAVCSSIYKYHFASIELIKLNNKRFLGSAVILGGVYSLSGKELMKPLTITDGFSNKTINALLDDIQRTFDHKIELKPITERLEE